MEYVLLFDLEYGPATVINFAEKIPFHLRYIFDHASFRNIINEEEEVSKINSALFFKAFDQAEKNLFENLDILRQILPSEFQERLENIGFTGPSLQLKARRMNSLWNEVVSVVNSIGQGVIDFAKAPIVKVIRKTLTYLNNILGSLKNAIPGLEAIKEIKEVGESYLGIADEG